MASITIEETPPRRAAPRALATGFTALRIFFGLDWLSNGLAKLFDTGNYDWGFLLFQPHNPRRRAVHRNRCRKQDPDLPLLIRSACWVAAAWAARAPGCGGEACRLGWCPTARWAGVGLTHGRSGIGGAPGVPAMKLMCATVSRHRPV